MTAKFKKTIHKWLVAAMVAVLVFGASAATMADDADSKSSGETKTKKESSEKKSNSSKESGKTARGGGRCRRASK